MLVLRFYETSVEASQKGLKVLPSLVLSLFPRFEASQKGLKVSAFLPGADWIFSRSIPKGIESLRSYNRISMKH